MCEILYLRFSDEFEEHEKKYIIESITKNMYLRNPHGVGAIVDRKQVVKAMQLETFFNYLSLHYHAKEFVIHTRYATSGDHTLDNVHPLEYNGFKFIHNGMFFIISEQDVFKFKHTKLSDSALFLRYYSQYVVAHKHEDLALYKLLKKSYGEWSMFVVKGGDLLYTKYKRPFDIAYATYNGKSLVIGAKLLDLVIKEFGEFKEVAKYALKEKVIYRFDTNSHKLLSISQTYNYLTYEPWFLQKLKYVWFSKSANKAYKEFLRSRGYEFNL